MSGLMDDYEAQGRMLERAYEKLKNDQPNHELLKYMESDREGHRLTEDFWKVFSAKNDVHNIHAWTRYTFALEAVLNGREWKEHLPKEGKLICLVE